MQLQESLVEYGSRRVIITITAIVCALLEIVDTTIVNVALNDMKGNLGATTSEVGWVITSYAIGNVIVVPMTSWLSQQFGRRNYFAASLILFTVCSFLCGNATGIGELILFRFLQGVGGGALLVTSQTIITESYPQEKRGMAQALYGMGVIIGPTLGPPLGGYIIDNFSWPYIFYINIPLGIIAVLLTLQYVRSPKYAEKSKTKDIDWLGIALLAAFVGSLQYILENVYHSFVHAGRIGLDSHTSRYPDAAFGINNSLIHARDWKAFTRWCKETIACGTRHVYVWNILCVGL